MRGYRTALCAGLVAALAWAGTAVAAPPDDGKLWRKPVETANVSLAQTVAVCPRDGSSRCSGSASGKDLSGWIWATEDQVKALLGHYAPALLTAEPASVGGVTYLVPAISFVGEWGATFSSSTYASTIAHATGWTASERDGVPVAGHVGYGYPFNPSGTFSVLPETGTPVSGRGLWLWRPATDDLTAPAIVPVVSGTTGAGGWRTSDVSVSWNVSDAQSEVRETTGCENRSVTEDTAGVTFTCTATSAGGTAAVSTTVKRDTVPPSVTCRTPAPAFARNQPLARVAAEVRDATSGAATALPQVVVPTAAAGTFTVAIQGSDRAGLRATAQCPYTVQ
jgi:hypothetical protein